MCARRGAADSGGRRRRCNRQAYPGWPYTAPAAGRSRPARMSSAPIALTHCAAGLNEPPERTHKQTNKQTNKQKSWRTWPRSERTESRNLTRNVNRKLPKVSAQRHAGERRGPDRLYGIQHSGCDPEDRAPGSGAYRTRTLGILEVLGVLGVLEVFLDGMSVTLKMSMQGRGAG